MAKFLNLKTQTLNLFLHDKLLQKFPQLNQTTINMSTTSNWYTKRDSMKYVYFTESLF